MAAQHTPFRCCTNTLLFLQVTVLLLSFLLRNDSGFATGFLLAQPQVTLNPCSAKRRAASTWDEDPVSSTRTTSFRLRSQSSSQKEVPPFKLWHPTSTAQRERMLMSRQTMAGLLAAVVATTTIVIPLHPATAFVSTDQIERVVDGDTVVTKSLGRLRMIGMNTPETVAEAQRESGAPPECYGMEASVFTKKLLPPGTAVRLETDQEPQDKFGRSLAYVFRSSDGLFINGELVKQGYARQRTYGRNTKYEDLLRGYEKEAQVAKKGLWGKCDVTSSPSTRAVAAVTLAPAAKPSAGSTATKTSGTLANPGDTKNCKDFETYRDAKAWYDKYYPLFGDVARLDGDGDGVPCESLPGAPKKP